MKSFRRYCILGILFGVVSSSSWGEVKGDDPALPICLEDVCVGDRVYSAAQGFREGVVTDVDIFGYYRVRFFYPNYEVDVRRSDLAITRGCEGDLCVGFSVFDLQSFVREATVVGIMENERFVIQYKTSTSMVVGNKDREDLGVAWGCNEGFCVNDTVYDRMSGDYGTIIAVQNDAFGKIDAFVIRYLNGRVAMDRMSWYLNLIQRGPVAYPPWPTPRPNPPRPSCPRGSHWDPYRNRCVADRETPPRPRPPTTPPSRQPPRGGNTPPTRTPPPRGPRIDVNANL